MAFGIIRVRSISSGEISSTEKHNARLYNSKKEYPENISPHKPNQTEYLVDGNIKENISLGEAISSRLESNNVSGIRKNSNHALEYVCTINDKKAWKNYSFKGFVANTSKWIEERHGESSVVARYLHEDESNPHVHFVVVPIKTKQVKWKNQNGEGVNTKTRLNTREFINGRDKLRQLQDDYFQHLCERYNGGEKLGLKLYRGTKIEQQHRDYTNKTDHVIGELRCQYADAQNEIEKQRIALEIAEKKAEKIRKEKEFLEKKKKANEKTKKNWKYKGTRDNKDIFHSKKEEIPKKGGLKM